MVANREQDNKAAIMIFIEHLGDVQPRQKCSAVFFDREKIRREKEFYAKLYSENGVNDPEILHAMVEANVSGDPYWLVSIKPAEGTHGQTRICKVDHRTGSPTRAILMALNDPRPWLDGHFFKVVINMVALAQPVSI